MSKITNVKSLGVEYTAYVKGKITKTIHVIQNADILDAIGGKFDFESDTFDSYLQKSKSLLCGFDKTDNIVWYSTYKPEIMLTEIVENAVINNYNKVILEYIEEFDDYNEIDWDQ